VLRSALTVGLGWRRQWGLGRRRQWGSVSADSGARSAPTEELVAAPTDGLVSAPAEIADVFFHTKSLITKNLTKCSTEI
jgi:hypothetical protein